jgi:N-acetylglucosamine kinase-like BadF-type ATPase
MKYIIGMDGGGTKTHAVITNLNGETLYETSGSATNFLVIGTDKACESILNLINECLKKLSIDYDTIAVVLLGTTGAGRRSDAERLEKAFSDYLNFNKLNPVKFHVESDARIALEGAFSGMPGSILIAGTGSIMFGKDINGNIYRVGGFGRYLGDEGSGYSIGKKGLAAVSKDYDGRGTKSLMSKLLSEKFNIKNSEELITAVYKNNFDIASIVPIVFEAAEKNDPSAVKIIDEESDELILHVIAMSEKIKETFLNLSFIGGILSSDNIFSRMVREKIKERLLNVIVKKPDYPPEMGAVLMAKNLI